MFYSCPTHPTHSKEWHQKLCLVSRSNKIRKSHFSSMESDLQKYADPRIKIKSTKTSKHVLIGLKTHILTVNQWIIKTFLDIKKKDQHLSFFLGSASGVFSGSASGFFFQNPHPVFFQDPHPVFFQDPHQNEINPKHFWKKKQAYKQ